MNIEKSVKEEIENSIKLVNSVYLAGMSQKKEPLKLENASLPNLLGLLVGKYGQEAVLAELRDLGVLK